MFKDKFSSRHLRQKILRNCFRAKEFSIISLSNISRNVVSMPVNYTAMPNQKINNIKHPVSSLNF
jgi:hypothetical protein